VFEFVALQAQTQSLGIEDEMHVWKQGVSVEKIDGGAQRASTRCV
jgi:hypothetical protein